MSKKFSFLANATNYEYTKQDREHMVNTGSRDIAIIGLSSRFPFADNYTEFWDVLSADASCIRTFPAVRKQDAENYLKSIRPTEHSFDFIEGAYLDQVDQFDYSFFRITPIEANMMNPNQRIFLETAWECLEDAGYGGDKIKGTNTGVYVGYMADSEGSQYRLMASDTNKQHYAAGVTGNLASIIPSRISYLLDLKGPSLLVDTACSSSLVAIHLACSAIRSGECSMALAGGVRTVLLPLNVQEKIGIESMDGRTRAFDDLADGTGIGEGAAAILLKPLDEALKDRDHIYAVVKGTAVNQDGASIGITAPNVVAQTEVIVKAWRDAGIEPETISYIESHGTGTNLGDPIEINGIHAAFQKFTDRKQFCGIGSLKSNIGHLYDCAGIAGMLKLVLSLQHREIPASIHFTTPNRKIDFLNSPIYLVNRKKKWEKNFPLRAGISSFGFSGTNCHIVVEEAPRLQGSPTVEGASPEVFTLTANSKRTLIRYIDRYYQFLTDHEDIDLKNLCYSANTGRSIHSFRIAMIVESIAELKEYLNRLIGGVLDDYRDGKGPIFYGDKETKKSTNTDISDHLVKLAQAYTEGENIRWLGLYNKKHRYTIPLPTYPFERERCWISIPDSDDSVSKAVGGFSLEGKANSEMYSETEYLLGKIWSEELGYTSINIHSSLYEMGGDSILATKIVNRYNQICSSTITIADVLKWQTISELAHVIEHREYFGVGNQSIYIIEALPPQPYYPISSAQKRIYILQQMIGKEISYNMPFAIKVEGLVDYSRLEEAIVQLIHRHEAFRTSFHDVDGEIVQRISDQIHFTLHHQHSTLEQLPNHIRNFIIPFSLNQGPLIRANLFCLHAGNHVLLIDMHHIISDGTSLSILLQDFVQLYNKAEINALPIQYKDYAGWHNRFLQSKELEEMRQYWLDQFSGRIPTLYVPTDYPRPTLKNSEGNIFEFYADESLFGAINKLCLETQSTLFMILLSAYYLLLFKYSGQEDLIVGTPISGRRSADTEKMVGMFVNMLALRNYPNNHKSIKGFIEEVKENALSGFQNQDFQFEDLIDQLGMPRSVNRHPLFDVVFALQDGRMSSLQCGELQLSSYSINSNSKFDFTLQAFPRKTDILFTFEYSTQLFQEETMRNMAHHYLLVLIQMTQDRNQLIKELELKRADATNSAKLFQEMDFDF
ncbi:condensation domain-containing protein [Paenibacillus typhae]|uniref:Phosphopantetheine attachment site n=1 Tax=Paenibacillus typhae TaxID=1174501 RepID=A0A1G8F8A6_9BACL|nr:condensation domain-containing protein [Paenibacillus typhae]SDH78383.1 Phosphopantetheine attachment site [Paenibacillus typhae]